MNDFEKTTAIEINERFWSGDKLTDDEIKLLINYRKDLLIQFIRNDPLQFGTDDVDRDDILEGGGHEYELYKYKGRYYQVCDLNHYSFGDWYHNNYYQDIDGFRISYEMYIISPSLDENIEPVWTLVVGSEEVYQWKGRPRTYKKKTLKQIDIISRSFMKEMVKNIDKIDFDPQIALETIRYELEKRYLRRSFQYKDKKLGDLRCEEILSYQRNSPFYKY